MSLDHGSFFRRYGPAIAGPFRYRRRNFAVGEVDVLSTQLREFPSDAAPQQPNITNARAMAASGLGCAKTPALAPHVEISLSNCIFESQIILHTRGSMPCWRIVFSTFRGCMSFYTWGNSERPETSARCVSSSM